MIQDLDSTLAELLSKGLASARVEPVTITFETPNDQFTVSKGTFPAIDLFLYDVRENRDLRRVDPQVERRNGTMVQTRPPVRVDCSYLVTAWAHPGSTPAARDEHRLLGEVMRVLLRHPTLPESVLQGVLKSQELPLPTTSLQQGHLQNLAELWQALGGRVRAALNYTVTIAVQVAEPVDLGPPVAERSVDMFLGVGSGRIPDE